MRLFLALLLIYIFGVFIGRLTLFDKVNELEKENKKLKIELYELKIKKYEK